MSTLHKISIREASAFLECSEDRVLKALAEGDLPGVKMGKAWVIPRGAFFGRVDALAMEQSVDRRCHPGWGVSALSDDKIEVTNQRMRAVVGRMPIAKQGPGRPRKVTI